MAWTDPPDVITGELETASNENTYVRANLRALRLGEIALTSQAIGDVFYASSASQIARLAAGPSGGVLTTRGVGQPPAWGPSPVAMALILGG